MLTVASIRDRHFRATRVRAGDCLQRVVLGGRFLDHIGSRSVIALVAVQAQVDPGDDLWAVRAGQPGVVPRAEQAAKDDRRRQRLAGYLRTTGTLRSMRRTIFLHVTGEEGLYREVDVYSDSELLVACMDAVGSRPEVLRLRAWEAQRLALAPGQTLLDVGCGPGTAAIALAPTVSLGGRVVGIDSSEVMIAAARERSRSLPQCEFCVGDATTLDMDDQAVDAYRSERTYQWLADPALAWAEAYRVLRPHGRVSVIDTDWGTRVIDQPEAEFDDLFEGWLPPEIPNPRSGRRLLNQARAAGFVALEVAADTTLVTAWDPDRVDDLRRGQPPFAWFPMELVDAGRLPEQAARSWLASMREAGRSGRLFVALTLFAVSGTKPG